MTMLCLLRIWKFHDEISISLDFYAELENKSCFQILLIAISMWRVFRWMCKNW